MNPPANVLWESGRAEPIAARIAVAGDFLPCGKLTIPPGGWREAVDPLSGHFSEIEAAFLNLECPVGVERLAPRTLTGLGDIVSAPMAALDYMEALRARVVGFANNHSYDFGGAGVERTLSAIAQRGIVPLGAGKTLREDPDAFVWQGPYRIRVGFWAAARASHDIATRARRGVEPANIARAHAACEILRRAGAAFSIALLHCGCIRASRPDPGDARLMEAIAECGFDVVAASHSHRIGGAKVIVRESRSPRFCFYGLGSIVSGFVASPLEREGLLVVAGLHADGALARIEVRPVLLAENGFGAVPSADMAQEILGRFRALSQEISDGSAARRFYGEISRGLGGLYWRDASAALRASGLRGLIRKVGRVRMRHVRRLVYGRMK